MLNFEFFTYTLKLVIVVFQRQITKTQGEIILMKIINSLQIVNTKVKLLGLFSNEFSNWLENQTTTYLRLHAIQQAIPNLCIFSSPISIFRDRRYRGFTNHIIKLRSTKRHFNFLGPSSIITLLRRMEVIDNISGDKK